MISQQPVALITGANSGIGVHIAQRLVADGFAVVLTGRNSERGEAVTQKLGSAASWVPADLRDRSAVETLVDTARNSHGRLDVLVNNAAIDHTGNLLETPETEIRETFESNVFPAIACLQAAGRAMRQAGRGGAIINITSRLALIGVPTMGIYSASKGAVQSLTTAAAVELAPYQIRVNAVAPGMARTPLYEAWVSSQDNPERTEREVAEKIPLQRIATGEDVAAAVAYLASPGAAYVTGVTIPVDGGYLAQ